MAESIVQVDEGTGKKLHTFQRTIGANTVEDEVVVHGEQYLATYGAFFSTAAAAAASDKHPFELMAGASLKLRVREIHVWQQASSSAAVLMAFDICRLTSAGTGGTVRAISPFDPADAAAGATLMQAPTTEGAEGVVLLAAAMPIVATQPNLGYFHWVQHPGSKPIVVAAGTANGIGLNIITGGGTGTTIRGYIVFDESSF